MCALGCHGQHTWRGDPIDADSGAKSKKSDLPRGAPLSPVKANANNSCARSGAGNQLASAWSCPHSVDKGTKPYGTRLGKEQKRAVCRYHVTQGRELRGHGCRFCKQVKMDLRDRGESQPTDLVLVRCAKGRENRHNLFAPDPATREKSRQSESLHEWAQ